MASAKGIAKKRGKLIQAIKEQKARKESVDKKGEPVPPGGGKNNIGKPPKKPTGRRKKKRD